MRLPRIDLHPIPTSYYSRPDTGLDPQLFDGRRMHPGARWSLLNLLKSNLDGHFKGAKDWSHAWVAGSGASYQWDAARTPADLDVLVGVDYPAFRQHNQNLAGLSDAEISSLMNSHFRNELHPKTKSWVPPGFDRPYEATFYVNPTSWDIKHIQPYAAYSLTNDSWDVPPDPRPRVPDTPEVRSVVQRDREWAGSIIDKYNETRDAYLQAKDPASRRNAYGYMRVAMDNASGLFDDIHFGRRAAFGPMGQGYADVANARWQAGKGNGVVEALGQLRDLNEALKGASEVHLYQSMIGSSNEALMTAMLAETDQS